MASSALDLLFKIKADSSDAQSDISKLRRTFETEVKGIESTGKNSFLKLGESMGLTTGQMAGIAKAAPLVGSAVAAMGAAIVGAAVAVGYALFSLAKETAEFGSKINDASLKTGLTAETLSGLDLQLKQSGTTMEAFTRGVFLLQKNLTTMAQSGKEGQEALAKIGLKPDQLKDTEVVLRAVLKHLAAIPDETARNAEGAKLMGRSYQELSVFVADTGGDIDAVIEKARELGLVMSQDAAAAADHFGDKMDELSNRSLAAGRTIGQIVIPGILDAINQLNTGFKTIPDVVEGATFAVRAWMYQYVVLPLQVAQMELLKLKNTFGTMGDFMAGVIKDLNTAPESGGDFGEFGERAMRRRPDISGGGGGGGGRGGRSPRAVETEEDKAAKKAVDDLAKSQQMLNSYMEAQAAKLYEATTTMPKYILTIANLALAMNKLGGNMDSGTKRLAIHNAVTLEAIKLAAEQQNKLDDLNNVIVTERSLVDALVDSAKTYGETLNPVIERTLRMNAAHLDLVATLERLRDTIPEIDWDAMSPGTGGIPGADVHVGVGPPPEMFSLWEQLGRVIQEAMGTSVTAIQFAGFAFNTFFDGIRNGIAASIQAAILYGGSIGQAFKKGVAAALSAIAAEAAIQAIFNLAKGFAALAGFMPGPAALYFKSAALFGLAAVGAGGVARAFAGSSFQQQGTNAGGGSGGSGGGTGARGYEAPTTNVVEQNRNQQPVRVDVFVHSNDSHILDVVQNDVRSNGPMRQTFVLRTEF